MKKKKGIKKKVDIATDKESDKGEVEPSNIYYYDKLAPLEEKIASTEVKYILFFPSFVLLSFLPLLLFFFDAVQTKVNATRRKT